MKAMFDVDRGGWLRLLVLACALAGCSEDAVAPAPSEQEQEQEQLQTPAAPVARHAEEVAFPSTGLTLEGTLLVPAHTSGERLPAVILGHGSGPIDRDETISGQLGMGFGFSIAVLGELAEALADAGYVVLRYDKRSCTALTGCQNGYPPGGNDSVDDYVVDLQAGLDFLQGRAEVDGERLYYVGHSQGAQFAPELLASRANLKAAVMIAGPYHSIDEVLAYQEERLRSLLEATGAPSDLPELVELQQGLSELRQLREGSFTGSSILSYSARYWQSWLDLSERASALVPDLERPLLALSGDYDWNVPASETDAWAAAFAGLPEHPGHEAMVLPCLTHALNCVRQPDWRLIAPADIGRSVDAQVPAEIVRFFALHGGAQPPAL